MTIRDIADLTVVAWAITGVALFLYSWINPIVLTAFLISRIVQLRDSHFDLRPNTPTHTALHHFCALTYGLVFPTFYFLSVRARHELGPWHLGGDTNSVWTIALGGLCMTWLAAHLIEAALRLGPPRYGPSWVNRTFTALGTALCLWFHVKTTEAGLLRPASQFGPPGQFFTRVVMSLAYPQFCFLGASLVYGLAFLDCIRPGPGPELRRRWAIAFPVATTLLLILFAPLWMSIPRVTHRQALALLDEQRGLIAKTAHEADLDPRLLAGIIYVAQTRDHPRWTGDAIEEFGIALWEADMDGGLGSQFETPLINASAGPCQIRPTTAVQTLHLVGSVPAPNAGTPMSGSLPYSWTRAVRGFTRGGTNVFQSEWRFVAHARERCGSLAKNIWRKALEGRLEPVLLEPENSLALAALMLAILDEQWRVAGHPISDRPDILATLYNLGYERSQPKPNPQPNDFGRRVAAFMQSDDCHRLFPHSSPSPPKDEGDDAEKGGDS